jgi:hypothetical protein
MPADVQGGFGLQVRIDISATMTAIAEVIDGEIPEFEKFLAEMTPHSAAGGYATHVATGKRKMNEIKLTLGWDSDDATHAAILAAFDGSPSVRMTVISPDQTDEVLGFDAHIFKVGRIAQQEDGYKCDVSIQPSAAPTRVTKYTFEGSNGIGACALVGALEDDIVVHGYRSGGDPYSGVFADDFETSISVNDEIQQVSVADLSGVIFTVKLVPSGTL